GSKHYWLPLKFICDLAEVIRSHPNLNWEWILTQAEQLRTRRMVFLGLYLCWDLLDTSLPASIIKKIQSEDTVRSLASQVKQQLFSGVIPKSNMFRNNLYVKAMETLRDKMWFYFDYIITPTPWEWAVVPLPTWLFPLYYLIRPIRLTIRQITNSSDHEHP
ncbi:MAG: nucleotidyltransferase family protein, partial [Leptolyngbyaceae bacterium]|nr:nucleotidyltransferase family protein [Leptolyngbyaceae bacterium]